MALDLEVKKEIAKVGLTVTLGTTVITSMFMKNSAMKKLHVGAGVALVGFSIWHHMLYNTNKKKTIKIDKEENPELITENE